LFDALEGEVAGVVLRVVDVDAVHLDRLVEAVHALLEERAAQVHVEETRISQ